MVIKKNNLGSSPDSFVSNAGSPIKNLFRGVVKDNGMIELVPDGKENLYQKIQSYRDSVDINRIVARYAAGEIDILNQVQGVYADVTSAPGSLADALNRVREARLEFDRLPEDVRRNYGFSAENWIESAGSDEWLKAMGFTKESNSAPAADADPLPIEPVPTVDK